MSDIFGSFFIPPFFCVFFPLVDLDPPGPHYSFSWFFFFLSLLPNLSLKQVLFPPPPPQRRNGIEFLSSLCLKF